jgi:hypothetical protein
MTNAHSYARNALNRKILKQQKVFSTWRRFDDMATLMAMAGLLTSLIGYELDVSRGSTTLVVGPGQSIHDYDAMDTVRYRSLYNKVFKWFTLATTLAAIGCLVMRRRYKTLWADNFLNDKVDRIMTYGPLVQEYNRIILGADSISPSSPPSRFCRSGQTGAQRILQPRGLCSPLFVFEILVLLP